jgi:hypothetical protein
VKKFVALIAVVIAAAFSSTAGANVVRNSPDGGGTCNPGQVVGIPGNTGAPYYYTFHDWYQCNGNGATWSYLGRSNP